jgi:acyl-CoA dehydrogenase
MNFEYSDKVKDLVARVTHFVDTHITPNESVYYAQLDEGDRWRSPEIMEDWKARAKSEGLWNLFLPADSAHGAGLTNLEYAPVAEAMGRSYIAPEAFNCGAPDTGNMELLDRYGTPAQKDQFLTPLLNGDIRSGFCMTEPAVASSDATNIASSIVRDGDHYVLNGRKWWTSGGTDPRTKMFVFMGKTDPTADAYSQQSLVLVEADTPGVTIERHLPVFGFDEAPTGRAQILFDNVRVPTSNVILGEGRGFEAAQNAWLGPGRIHHCMRTIGAAEVALTKMCQRLSTRHAFGSFVSTQTVWHERIADARINIDMTRLLTLKAAATMDTAGNRDARAYIAMIKVAAPTMALKVIDDAIQAFGGAGVTTDPGLAYMWAGIRILRIADGPDEVLRNQIAKIELKRQAT